MNTALLGVSRIFLDTSPVIYYIEGDQWYLSVVQGIFTEIDTGALTAVTSPVTLAECIVVPYRKKQLNLQQAFVSRIVSGDNTEFIAIDQQIAEHAAELRARYNIELLDALQLGVALSANCDAFLTNDVKLRRVTQIKVIVVDELES